MLIITDKTISSELGTVVQHDGSREGRDRAMLEIKRIDEQKTLAANARASNAGHNQPLTPEQIRTGSWRDATVPLRVRMAVDKAKEMLKTHPKAAASFVRTAIEGAQAKLQSNNFQDDGARREIEMLTEIEKEFIARGNFLAEAQPAKKPEVPTTPRWIDDRIAEVEGDWNLTADQKARRLTNLRSLKIEEQVKIDAEAERKAKFECSEYMAAEIDSRLSLALAEISHDLSEADVARIRARHEQLLATGDTDQYHAERVVHEGQLSQFREQKKAERAARDKAERDAAGDPRPEQSHNLYTATPPAK